jgi:diacylglycerol kinase family enzyme
MRQLGYLLGSRGSAEATRSIDDLYRAAEEFKAAGIDILGINGGDGTLHVTLTAFIQVYGSETPLPKIAILRGGTLNTIARGLGIFGKTQDILYGIIDRYHQGEDFKTIERPVMQIGDKYGFLFGNGLIANFLAAYYATGKPSPWMGVKVMLRAIGSAIFRTKFTKHLARRFHGRVTADGQTWAREDFCAITGGTVPEIGVGFAPFYRCFEKEGRFALLGIHCGPIGFALDLPRVYRSKPMRRDKAISEVCTDVKIESDEDFDYMIDGDIYHGARDLVIKTGPKLQIIIP